MKETVAWYRNVQEKVPQALKFGKIRKYAKNVQNSLWGIEPGPTDPESGVYTTRPRPINFICNVVFSEQIELLLMGINEQCLLAHT